jgi:hypothetical protein
VATAKTKQEWRPRGILERVTCPHCWEQFPPEKLLWISEHSDLLGDQRLGPDHQTRFLPTRFNVAGEALDVKGFICHQLACPNCHLSIPRSLLEMEPLFLSIFGAPASGKSYFLAAMTWELRKILPLEFRVSFADADPVMNRNLNDYEESVFSGSSADELVPLASLIRKTEEQGDLYDTVSYGNQTVSYPRPFLFTVQPQTEHPNGERRNTLSRTVCLYDNAGESFQPGKDSAAAPVTRHMAHSSVLFFVFDPTQDSRFQRKMTDEGCGLTTAPRTMRQEPILQEAAARIRRYAGLRQSEKHNRPLVVILTKFDAWWRLLANDAAPNPWQEFRQPNAVDESNAIISALHPGLIEHQSQLARDLLLRTTPEIVTAAEGFAREVIYVPVSAVGWNVEVDRRTRQQAIRPVEAQPYWVTVPFLYGLSRSAAGLIPSVTRRPDY